MCVYVLRVSYFARQPNFWRGDTYRAELTLCPFRFLFGGTGAYAGFKIQINERGVEPTLWRTLWQRPKKREDE